MKPPILPPVLLVAVWALVGLAGGALLRWGSVKLAVLEDLKPRFDRVLVLGPIVLSGLLFAMFAARVGSSRVLLIDSLWILVLVQVIFFDFEHRLILDRVLVPAMVVALGLSFFTPHLSFLASLLTGLGAGLLFLLVALAGAAIFRAEALGFGDVKLAVFIGTILGFPDVFSALLYGVVMAGVFSLVLIALRRKSMKDSIAYGPYLAAGTLVVLFELGAR
jgi:leader peptidase (prepilin peptidase)/N-methyltransferase